ncbi:hypothetical protein RRG08_050111 [Elysia crispata]|uniref:Uncharacterized protein n=1 Tax=Elysia crispata TaxID=231223 RepID=A0AAE1DAD3_9GAST|nr:hypothetical protein RRG08_050111 [Elysia crispata]
MTEKKGLRVRDGASEVYERQNFTSLFAAPAGPLSLGWRFSHSDRSDFSSIESGKRDTSREHTEQTIRLLYFCRINQIAYPTTGSARVDSLTVLGVDKNGQGQE